MLKAAPPPRPETEFLALLSAANRRRLLEGSTQMVVPAGTIAIRPGGPAVAFLLQQGLARAYWNLPDGRQATVAFVHPNDLTGGAGIVGDSPWAFMQVITDSTLTALDMKRARILAKSEIEVAAAISKHLAMRMRQADRLIAIRSLGSIRERLAYDLLDRAGRRQVEANGLQIRATQSDLADSIGSSREVMSRALKDFRNAGLVETTPGLILILKPAYLAEIVRAYVI